jgi:hypothetical protein
MTFNKKYLLIIVLALSVSYSFAQTKTLVLTQTTLPPGNIKLLPGYIHERKQGIDTVVGTISKKDGLAISYDIGENARNCAEYIHSKEKQNLVWIKNQKVNNYEATIILLKNGNIYATHNEYANFISNVKTNEEIADFLLMVMTYGTQDKLNDKKPK